MPGLGVGAASAAPGGVLGRTRFAAPDLPAWSAAVRTMQAGGREARLLCIGDSVTQGLLEHSFADLLRAQQGTEVEMRAGAAQGATAVFLDGRLARAEIGRSERGLPLVCRAGPAGAAPGGAGFREVGFTPAGVHARPWSPCGLMVETTDAGRIVRWTPRVRLYGDGWDGEPATVDPLRFRVRVLDGDLVVRTFEVEGSRLTYPLAAFAADFPQGPGSEARIAVAQWGEGFGWGVEASVGLEIGPV